MSFSPIMGEKIPWEAWEVFGQFKLTFTLHCAAQQLCDNNMRVTKTKQEILHIHTEHHMSAFFPILI